MSTTLLFENGDIAINDRGRTAAISGINKLMQDLLFHLMTAYDEDRDIGNELIDMDIPPMVGKDATLGYIASQVRRTVERFDRHQQNLIEAGIEVPDTERLDKISRLEVKQYPATAGTYTFLIAVKPVEGTPTEQILLLNLDHQEIPSDFPTG